VGRLDYYFGCGEGKKEEIRNKLLSLVGKKIKHVSTDSSRMDGRLEFDEGYILEVFTHSKMDPWKICHEDKALFRASIEI
jgi:hypothetical protein